MKRNYKFYRQLDEMDCGPACIKMIAASYGKEFSLDFLRINSYITKNGVNLAGLSLAAEKIGLRTRAVKLTYEQVVKEAPCPCVLHWNQNHFVVLYKVKRAGRFSLFQRTDKFVIADPGQGLVTVDRTTFRQGWLNAMNDKGITLLLKPTEEFFTQNNGAQVESIGFKFLLKYLKPYRKYLLQIIMGMLLSSIITLFLPFLTKTIVDYGIQRNDIHFIYLILASQLLLFAGGLCADMIRNQLLLHINSRVSVTIISNFLAKLMKLPINFFESKNIGDVTQRINDHNRIENFLTGSTLNTLFSLVNLVMFSIVLAIYNLPVLEIFFLGSTFSIGWIFLFQKRRKDLDFVRFQRMKENQNTIFELVTGMQEMKLNNCENVRRWQWEHIQAKLFKVNIKSLALEQYQEIGSTLITQLKNILISFVAAIAVIHGQITLGVMLSISYIVGQMNSPLTQIISFIRNVQDARLSLDRLNEIHQRDNEDNDFEVPPLPADAQSLSRPRFQLVNGVRCDLLNGILMDRVSFQYGGPKSSKILDNINLFIPKGKITAIVGMSGSGKTTLLKLLLKFYDVVDGQILVDGNDIRDFTATEWRKRCGTVMQDGYIFSDTIEKNIAASGEDELTQNLDKAIEIANLQDYIENLPMGLQTKIGNTGTGMSGGQKQRVFIARAVCKDPAYIFFDEATSALDANNEHKIMENLALFFKGRTVVIIAHRLSTVKNADQIVVLQNGRVIEVGTHRELVDAKKKYFELIRDQLDLDVA